MTTPSFCYTVPLPAGRVLVEETCLVGRPPLPAAELQRRLSDRLTAHRVRVPDDADPEWVDIPMTPPAPTGPHRFGAAGDELNPISGYSVLASLGRADAVARSLLDTGRVPRLPGTWTRHRALSALLRLPPSTTVELFDAFGRLGTRHRRAVLDPTSPASALLSALTRQWAGMPRGARARLVAATAGWAR